MKLNESLQWRYSVKKYSNQKINNTDLQTILQGINLSASSAGLQPYRVLVIDNQALMNQLAEGEFNPQIKEASHLLVFAVINNLSAEHIDAYMQRTATLRGVPLESLDYFRSILIGHVTNRSQEENVIWATKQAYIGLGTGIAVASELSIDTTPMEGFNPAKFDAILGLKEQGLQSVVLLALGYRDAANDPYATAAKVRLPLDEFVITTN